MNSDREKVYAKVLEIEDRKTVATLFVVQYDVVVCSFLFCFLNFENLFVCIFVSHCLFPVRRMMPFFVIA